jgi:hypothetical protein
MINRPTSLIIIARSTDATIPRPRAPMAADDALESGADVIRRTEADRVVTFTFSLRFSSSNIPFNSSSVIFGADSQRQGHPVLSLVDVGGTSSVVVTAFAVDVSAFVKQG